MFNHVSDIKKISGMGTVELFQFFFVIRDSRFSLIKSDNRLISLPIKFLVSDFCNRNHEA